MVAFEQDVVGLDVAVDDAGGVGGVEGLADLGQQVDRLLGRQRPGRDPLLQVAAVDQAHRDDQLVVLLARVVDRDDVGVIEAGGEARLAQEPLAEALVAAEVAGDHLQRHLAIEGEMGRPVDDAHPAARDQRVEPVPAESRADCRFPHAAVIPARGRGPRHGEGPAYGARQAAQRAGCQVMTGPIVVVRCPARFRWARTLRRARCSQPSATLIAESCVSARRPR